MKKITLLLLFNISLFFAQNGDEIATAVNCPDNIPVTATHVPNATTTDIPGLNCVVNGEDAFYFNAISTDDNIIEISMVTTVAVVTTINYQILKAPNGDTNNLQEITCDSYNVIAGAPPVTAPGGAFSETINTNISLGDIFYLRVYKPTGLTGTALQNLFNNTTVQMKSYDGTTLFNDGVANHKTQLLSYKDTVVLTHAKENTKVDIYSLNGKKVKSLQLGSTGTVTISTAGFNTGIYMLKAFTHTGLKTYKFHKH